MYKSKSEYIFQKGCCCGYDNEDKSPIKEISNPMPLDYIFRPDTGSNTGQTKRNVLKKTDRDNFMTINSSTFPRTARNALPQIPIETVDKTDFMINPPKDSFYQEIADDEKPTINHIKPSKSCMFQKNMNDSNKKQFDLIFITSRIFVAYVSEGYRGEHSKVVLSLKHQYKSNLKTFYLNIRSTIENQDKTSLNTLSSLPYLMPFLDDIYDFLTSVTLWLHKSKKNVILMTCHEKANHLCAVCVRFILFHEEMNRRLLRTDNLILSDHESNALLFYEKNHLERYHTMSLKRCTSTVSNIMMNIIHYRANIKHLHIIILKNIHSMDRYYEGFSDKSQSYSDHGHSYGRIRSIYLSIYQNFYLIYTTYKVTLNDDIEADRIIFIFDPIIPISGDILIIANVTNNMGFQSIYFRLQLHTCLINGDLATFKYSEVDKTMKKEIYSRTIGLVELHFKNLPSVVRDHENMLNSNKYFVVKDRGTSSRDIFSQIKLLKQCDTNNTLSYTAGPLDGNLYAAIPKPFKSVGGTSKNDSLPFKNSVTKYQEPDGNTPSILRKFQTLENEISNAVELISTPHSNIHSIYDNKLPKYTFHCPENNVHLRGSTVKAIKNSQKSFLPYRKSHSLSNNELPLKTDKDERQYFLSYRNVSPHNITLKKPEVANKTLEVENVSPYDNLFIRNHIKQPPKNLNIDNVPYIPQTRMHESNYELISPTNEISNFSDSRNTKYSPEVVKNNDTIVCENIITKKESNIQLYDNHTVNTSKEVYNVFTSQKLWFKPYFSRQDAIEYLLDRPVGYFVIRISTSLSKSLSIVIKCSTSIFNKDAIENDSLDHIKHFIIDYNSEGYKIRGFLNEKYYSDLAKLIHDHLDKRVGLPCNLLLPSSESEEDSLVFKDNFVCHDRYMTTDSSPSIQNSFNVIYLGSFITKSLSDLAAISASVDTLQERVCRIAHEYLSNSLTKMSLKITHDRIIFTDLNRKMFFRKHCKLEDIMCCEVDPKRRVWSNMSNFANTPLIPSFSPIFGLVSCLNANTEFSNQTCCQLFLAIGFDPEDLCLAVNNARFTINK